MLALLALFALLAMTHAAPVPSAAPAPPAFTLCRTGLPASNESIALTELVRVASLRFASLC